MKPVRYIVGAVGFLLVWFVVAAVADFIVRCFIPSTNGRTGGFAFILDWRNLPGAILGLLAGIHSFRASVRQPQMKSGKVTGFSPIKILAIVLLIIFVCIGGVIYAVYKQVSQFNHLEQNARKVITGPELQSWAMNLLAQYPQTNMSVDIGASNCPVQLRKLCPRLVPYVFVLKLDDGRVPSVRLVWGGGLIGHEGFEIGPTNFVGEGHKWLDGVYFYRNE